MTKSTNGGSVTGGRQVEDYQQLTGGKGADSMSGRTFDTVNPYSGQVGARAADAGPEDIDAAVAAARVAFEGEWGASTGFERAALMRRPGDLVIEDAERLARLEVNDSGKLHREMVGQMKAMGGWCHDHAGRADKIEGHSVPTPNPDYLVHTTRVPVDVVAAITPGNSPLSLLTWKLAPALAAGCTMVVKPSEHSPIPTVVCASLLAEAGFPAGVLNVMG
ncbi:aldehyde dehydrogenase family protein [Streptomyces buecherae]|uniref:aldehyde dehydrogenase family protein n=1 Tax=Streptomyces buecherae TaxID=2763006 RepID=UPI0033D93BC7